ncbi:hypothetical protein AB0O34_34415 [Sphaerisporangium sp. NPDC088356]|uniref:hypothetical protein n=1 Tax=Sphaerisporangium sp. NPDC088356 TaxID=3154871 RepID=UPI00343A3632
MSQIIDYGDPYMEMLSIFLRLLGKVIAESSCWSADVCSAARVRTESRARVLFFGVAVKAK